MGTYPLINLSEARQKHDVFRKLLAQNINPAQKHAAEKATRTRHYISSIMRYAVHQDLIEYMTFMQDEIKHL
ncbi:hypothetical protein RC77_10095 [Pectobacterium brasiliense]|nr:hypothetical protein RC77_10095 [Pectobacterium brasiliense]KHT20195.1 hypothetical protein RC95_11070 [Pectobacterium brasiliense]